MPFEQLVRRDRRPARAGFALLARLQPRSRRESAGSRRSAGMKALPRWSHGAGNISTRSETGRPTMCCGLDERTRRTSKLQPVRNSLRRARRPPAMPALSPAHPRHLAAGHRAACRAGVFLHRDHRCDLPRPDAAGSERRVPRRLPDVEGSWLHDPVRHPGGARRPVAQDLDDYCKPDGRLGAHPDYETPGIAASTGSLGHGLGMATGQAYAEKLKKHRWHRSIACSSDGEFQEGSTWEAMMMAANLEARQSRRLHGLQRFRRPRPHRVTAIRPSIRWSKG